LLLSTNSAKSTANFSLNPRAASAAPLLVLLQVCLGLTIMRLIPRQSEEISISSKSFQGSGIKKKSLQLSSGNDYEVQVPQFQQYYDALIEYIDPDTQYANLVDFRTARSNDSVTRNPYFFYTPLPGVPVLPAGFSFPVRMIANYTEFPERSLSKRPLMSFFSIAGKSRKFSYTPGPWPRTCPRYWYKRVIDDGYTIPSFLL